MKTLFCYIDNEKLTPDFFELEGDYSHLHDVFINSNNEELWDELTKIINSVYSWGLEDIETIDQEIILLKEPTKDWDHFVVCGFIN